MLVKLHRAGFRSVRTEPYKVAADQEDLFFYSAKHRPELYLDARVRAGISTFAALAEPSEVEAGCERLAHDIQSGQIADVLRTHRNEAGDYIFLIAEAE